MKISGLVYIFSSTSSFVRTVERKIARSRSGKIRSDKDPRLSLTSKIYFNIFLSKFC